MVYIYGIFTLACNTISERTTTPKCVMPPVPPASSDEIFSYKPLLLHQGSIIKIYLFYT